MKGHPMPWWPRDFAADEHVMMMTLEAEGLYRRLLDFQWTSGSIPADIRAIAVICKGIDVRKVRRIWAQVSPLFTPCPDNPQRLINQRLERVRAEQEAYRAAKAFAGNRSATARQQKGNRTPTHGQPPTPSPVPSLKEQQISVVENQSPDLPPVSVPYLTQCVMALNAGLSDNRHLGGQFREVSASEVAGQVTWEAEGIALDTAVETIRRVAAHYRPKGQSRQPWNLRYFNAAVREAAFGKKRDGPRQPDRWVDPHRDRRTGALKLSLQDVLPTVVGQITGAA